MKVTPATLPEVLILEPQAFGDDRGYFLETYNKMRYRDAGIAEEFVQDNLSFSTRGVLRGLHFQNPNAQGKLVSVLEGEVFDVAVDIRRSSPHFGKWFGIILSAANKKQLYVPPGFAHGFVVTGETALFSYKCTAFYDRNSEHSIVWNDPGIGIAWPVAEPVLSSKDAQAPTLEGTDLDSLPAYAR